MSEEEKMAWEDYDGMNDPEVYVLLLLDETPISRTRVQRLLLLANIKLDLGLEFFEGNSDDIEEALEYLRSAGFCRAYHGGYSLTEYGSNVRELASLQEFPRSLWIESIRRKAAEAVDKDLVAITAHYYPEARNERTQYSVGIYAEHMCINGTPLTEFPKDLFEKILGNKMLEITGRER